MKIRIMKRAVLDKIKENIDVYIENYYTHSNNDWLWNVCDCDPFEDYKVVHDFELANLNQAPSSIDFDNCKILFSNLNFLNESQAADERLWAGLTNDYFYDYMRKRYNMTPATYRTAKNPIGDVISRFFYKNSGRSGYFRNALAKCWWVGHHTYDSNNRFKLLDTLGSNDMSTKTTDIFHNYTFTSNKEILTGIIEGIGYFNSNGIKYTVMTHVRPTLQYINAIGGSTVLDIYSSAEIRDIFIDKMNEVLNGGQSSMSYGDSDDEEEDTIVIDENAVRMGDKIVVQRLDDNNMPIGNESTYVVRYKSETDFTLFPIPQASLGKKVNDLFSVTESNYKLIRIER